MFCGELPAERHRALHIGLLHSQSNGLVELAAGTRRDGTLHIHTRARADHFLPGGGTGAPGWLEALLALAAIHADRGEELFIAPAVRSQARGEKHAVAHTRALWVDIDQPGQLHRLWALLAERPCHLLVESGGGGAHAYWLLDKPLPATDEDQPSGLPPDPIERAHARIIHRLGVDQHGRPNVADVACKDRSRLMRLSGSVNGKTCRHARILEADFQLAPYTIEQLVGDLPDPTPPGTTRRPGRRVEHQDPYKRISPPEYFEATRRDRGAARRAGPLPRLLARRPAPVLLGRNRLDNRLEMPRRQLRRGRRDLRPRLRAARRPVGPRAARRAVQTRPLLRRRRVRRAHLTPNNPTRREP